MSLPEELLRAWQCGYDKTPFTTNFQHNVRGIFLCHEIGKLNYTLNKRDIKTNKSGSNSKHMRFIDEYHIKKDIESVCTSPYNNDRLFTRFYNLRVQLGYEEIPPSINITYEALVIIQDALKAWKDGFEEKPFTYKAVFKQYHQLGERHKKENKMSKQQYINSIRNVLMGMFDAAPTSLETITKAIQEVILKMSTNINIVGN